MVCETAFKKFQNILTIKLNEFLPEKKRSEEIGNDNQVKKAAAKQNAPKQFWLKEKSSKKRDIYEKQNRKVIAMNVISSYKD